MRDMTDEEYDALDERLTRTIPKLGRNGDGFFSGKGFQMVALDETTARLLNAKALAEHRMPSEIITSLLYENLSLSCT